VGLPTVVPRLAYPHRGCGVIAAAAIQPREGSKMADEEKTEETLETPSEETKPDTPNDDIKPKDDTEGSPEDETADRIADMLRRIEKLETENENLRAMINNFGLNDKIGVTADGDNDGGGDSDSADEIEPEEITVEDLFKNNENEL
jgi:hypothetical protein